jgi:hypothetical protein
MRSHRNSRRLIANMAGAVDDNSRDRCPHPPASSPARGKQLPFQFRLVSLPDRSDALLWCACPVIIRAIKAGMAANEARVPADFPRTAAVRDLLRASRWRTPLLRDASCLGEAKEAAMVRVIGWVFYDGTNVPKDQVRARELMHRAALQGWSPAEQWLKEHP